MKKIYEPPSPIIFYSLKNIPIKCFSDSCLKEGDISKQVYAKELILVIFDIGRFKKDGFG